MSREMDCHVIGEANPDIAGIGILVAFVVQSVIAVIVSGYTWILTSKIQLRWDQGKQNPPNDILNRYLPQSLRRLVIARNNLFNRRTIREQMAWEDWLYGKQPQEPRQWTPESKIEDEVTPTTRRLEFANRILLAGSDSQTFTGIALLISALIQSKTMSLYHMHIIYDAISLVVISNCAASVCIFREGSVKGYIRLGLIAVWAVLFVVYFIIFAMRLQRWDTESPFNCYKTTAIAREGAPHPYVDNVYIGVTFFFITCSFFYSLYLSVDGPLRNKWAEFASSVDALVANPGSEATKPATYMNLTVQTMAVALPMLTGSTILPASDVQQTILSIAMLQCPLHIYSIFALRASNERYLEAGGSEREWGFGQIAAVVLLVGNLLPIVDGVAGLSEAHRTRKALEILNKQAEGRPDANRRQSRDGILLGDCNQNEMERTETSRQE